MCALQATVVAVAMYANFSAASELSAASQLIRDIERGEHPGIESFVMRADGELVGRYVAPTLESAPPDLRSATKSITALLVGIAIDRGEIPSVRARVVDLLPEIPAGVVEGPKKSGDDYRRSADYAQRACVRRLGSEIGGSRGQDVSS